MHFRPIGDINADHSRPWAMAGGGIGPCPESVLAACEGSQR